MKRLDIMITGQSGIRYEVVLLDRVGQGHRFENVLGIHDGLPLSTAPAPDMKLPSVDTSLVWMHDFFRSFFGESHRTVS